MVYSVYDLMQLWEGYGIFDVLFPFLLIFAIVFGILTHMRIFGDKKGIHVIIALVIGLMGVRYTRGYFFSQFYAELFPRLGIGVTVLLAIMILVGLFVAGDESRFWGWGFAAIAVIVAIIVLYQTFAVLGWSGVGAFGGGDTVGWIVFGVLIVGLIIAVAASAGPPKNSGRNRMGEAFFGPFFGERPRGERQ
jgi:hypothetical protein